MSFLQYRLIYINAECLAHSDHDVWSLCREAECLCVELAEWCFKMCTAVLMPCKVVGDLVLVACSWCSLASSDG